VVDYFECRLTIGHMVVMLVWHLVTASVIIAINLTVPIALLKFTVTLLMSSNSVLLVEKASTPFRLDAWVCIATTACSVN
jgi:hypothetical protein